LKEGSPPEKAGKGQLKVEKDLAIESWTNRNQGLCQEGGL